MADDELDPGFLAISLSDSEDAAEEPGERRAGGGGGGSRAERTAQSEDDFQAVRRGYRAKVENGEIWRTIPLPLGADVPKPVAQEVLHAVEELYFFGRLREAADFIGRVEGEGGAAAAGLDADTRLVLAAYKEKCLRKLGEGRS